MRVDDADLLDEVSAETPGYSPDLKALVLRMIHQQQGNLEVVATQTGLPKATLYSWLADWNMAQRTAKKTLVSRRGQGGGLASQVDANGWEVWRYHLQHQSVQHWTSSQLADVFEQFTGVRYSHSHRWRLLRHQQGMYYYKPRPCDYRRADDAEEQLRARIQATFDALQAIGYDLQQVKWGFADEVAAQLHSNNTRFWAFEPHLTRVVNTDRGSQSFSSRFGGPIFNL